MNSTFRKLALTIFPYRFIRKVLKQVNLKALLFSYAKVNREDYLVENTEYAFRMYDMESKLGYKISTGFILQFLSYINAPKLQREYIIDGGKCYIEPIYGWGIKFGSSQLIKDSVIYNRFLENYYPSWIKYKLYAKKRTKYYPSVVSIRMIKGAETNYWHFLSDMLGIIVLIDKHNFPRDIPLLITKDLAAQKFFKQVMAYSKDLRDRNWVIQDKEYILADHVFFCQKMPNSKEQLDGLLKMLDIPDADKTKNRKVFVRRSPARIRFIKNANEIESIAIKNGFEIIDCDNLSFSEQVTLFSECSHIVGIHGAGLTNILWRKNAPLTLLELFPENYVHPGYFWVAKSFDKEYLALTGSPILPDTSFHIDPQQFEEKLLQVLSGTAAK